MAEYNTRREQGQEVEEDFAFWMIAGLLGTGRVDHARTYLDEVQPLFPRSWRLDVARAAIAYHYGDNAKALAVLDAIPGDDGGRPLVLVNRIVVLAAQGNRTEAKEALDRLRKSKADPGILKMAEDLVNGIRG